MVIDELLGMFTGNGLICFRCADEIFIVSTGNFEVSFCGLIQRGLEPVHNWCSSMVGLKINVTKINLVPFVQERNLPHQRGIMIELY